MKRTWALGLAAGLVALAGMRAWADDEHGGKELKTLRGEVIDIACYVDHGAAGAGHADCAQKCIKSGLPVAIKVGDELYVAIGGDHQTANAALAKFAGKQVEVQGTVHERDDQKMIVVSTVKTL
ncbi:MAG: hypothetical protein HY597_01760 [Candidatus Omnitrophica bacterium]|nr:hypothetical protein [Candidatus Omnitrophota bacterium]